MVKVVTETFQHQQVKKKGDGKPLTTVWKDARMIRNHSLRACARDVLVANRGLDVVKINLIGSPSTGKTTLAKALGHLIHDLAWEINKTPYIVKVFSRNELLDMENTLKDLQPMNHIMIFDDVSWLVAGNNKAKLDQVQKTFTEIRHLPGGQDIKVVIIFNFHYNLSIPKHLRQAHFFGYTDLGSSELENTQKLVGNRNTPKLLEFRKVVFEAQNSYKPPLDGEEEQQAKFSYKVGKRGKFTYQFRNPFAPALWWNNDQLRHIVFPSREWIDPFCQVCTSGKPNDKAKLADCVEFKDMADNTYTESKIRNAIRIIMYKRGINCFSDEIKRAVRWVEKEMAVKEYDLEQLMELYKLTPGSPGICRKPGIEKQKQKEKEKMNNEN